MDKVRLFNRYLRSLVVVVVRLGVPAGSNRGRMIGYARHHHYTRHPPTPALSPVFPRSAATRRTRVPDRGRGGPKTAAQERNAAVARAPARMKTTPGPMPAGAHAAAPPRRRRARRRLNGSGATASAGITTREARRRSSLRTTSRTRRACTRQSTTRPASQRPAPRRESAQRASSPKASATTAPGARRTPCRASARYRLAPTAPSSATRQIQASGSVRAMSPPPACRAASTSTSTGEGPSSSIRSCGGGEVAPEACAAPCSRDVCRRATTGPSARYPVHERRQRGIRRPGAPVAVVEQLIVGQVQQALERALLVGAEARAQQVELEHPAPAAPAQAVELSGVAHGLGEGTPTVG